MKNFKRTAAAIAATLMAATLTAPMAMNAFAAENTVTINEANDAESTVHKYTVYQIFSGKAEASAFGGTAKTELKEPKWVEGANVNVILEALYSEATFGEGDANIFAGCTTEAASVAKALSGMTADQTKKFAKMAAENATTWGLKTAVAETEETSITLSQDGYYVISETAISKKEGAAVSSGTMTAYLLGVYDSAKGADISVKNGLPKFEKFIKDADDTAGTESEWQKDADHDMGDKVPFRLEATLPEDFASYDVYKLIFHDALQDTVFTYDESSAKIKLGAVDETGAVTEGEATAITPATTTTCGVTSEKGDDCDLEFTVNDVKTMFAEAKAGDKVIIEYTATLTTDAVLGTPGNWNGAYLEYSNNPNASGAGDTTSRTTEDTVVAFTYQTVINKVNSDVQPLTGAEFTLEKKLSDGTWKAIDTVKNEQGTTFTFTGLDDGDYRLKETKAPDGFNQIAEEIEFTVEATHADKELTALSAVIPQSLRINFNGLTADGSLTPNLSAGSLTGDIINTSGAELPSTGGMGTTLFYVGGGCMVAVAGLFLITKKRMNKKEN